MYMVSLALQIFGIYMIKKHETVTLEEVLQPGKDIKCNTFLSALEKI